MVVNRLQDAIESAKLAEWSENGRCSMCSSGHMPQDDGFHHWRNEKHRCGNADPCVLCRGCLPPGEICAACLRKNVYELEC